jgi:hypothetical protein
MGSTVSKQEKVKEEIEEELKLIDYLKNENINQLEMIYKMKEEYERDSEQFFKDMADLIRRFNRHIPFKIFLNEIGNPKYIEEFNQNKSEMLKDPKNLNLNYLRHHHTFKHFPEYNRSDV